MNQHHVTTFESSFCRNNFVETKWETPQNIMWLLSNLPFVETKCKTPQNIMWLLSNLLFVETKCETPQSSCHHRFHSHNIFTFSTSQQKNPIKHEQVESTHASSWPPMALPHLQVPLKNLPFLLANNFEKAM